jgi:hypothetical protein
MKTKRWLTAAALALGTAAPAWAQGESITPPLTMPAWNQPAVNLMIGGGVEGYLGGFSGELNPGPGWSVVTGGQATRLWGFELGYSGAVNDLSAEVAGEDGATGGADLVRHGGHAAISLNAPTVGLQPYALAGVGLDRYTFRAEQGAFGYRNDTSGAVPLGVGIRAGLGPLSADLRFNYDVLFGDRFSPVDSNIGDGRYSGLLHVGGRF